jgi:hypothetical protein
MTQIQLHRRTIESVFELIGTNENSLTFAVGWCLAKAPAFLAVVAKHLGFEPLGKEATILLQEHRGSHGITDIEIIDPGKAAWILEAKVGFTPPGMEQLEKYAERLAATPDPAAAKLLVVIAKSDRRELWLKHLVPQDVLGIPVRVLSWGNIRAAIREATGSSRHAEKRLLSQLDHFITKVLQMQNFESNSVFVVSVGRETFGGGLTSFIDVVCRYNKYFHPAAKNWPSNPPNYMAFRWDGVLQGVHHVDRYEIITTWEPHFPDTTEASFQPHYLYHLGPRIMPAHTVRTGNIPRAGRVWAALDLLLTCDTISEARDQTHARREEAANAG